MSKLVLRGATPLWKLITHYLHTHFHDVKQADSQCMFLFFLWFVHTCLWIENFFILLIASRKKNQILYGQANYKSFSQNRTSEYTIRRQHSRWLIAFFVKVWWMFQRTETELPCLENVPRKGWIFMCKCQPRHSNRKTMAPNILLENVRTMNEISK